MFCTENKFQTNKEGKSELETVKKQKYSSEGLGAKSERDKSEFRKPNSKAALLLFMAMVLLNQIIKDTT